MAAPASGGGAAAAAAALKPAPVAKVLRMGQVSRAGSMSATVFSANANVSRHARRAPLTGTVQREVSDRQRGFLKVLTRVPEAIDPNLPVPSAGERLLLTAAAGFAWDSGNEIYTALADAR